MVPVVQFINRLQISLCSFVLSRSLRTFGHSRPTRKIKVLGNVVVGFALGEHGRGNRNAVPKSLWPVTCFAKFIANVMKDHCQQMCPGREFLLTIMPYEALALLTLSLKRLAIQHSSTTWGGKLTQKGKQQTRPNGRLSYPNFAQNFLT